MRLAVKVRKKRRNYYNLISGITAYKGKQNTIKRLMTDAFSNLDYVYRTEARAENFEYKKPSELLFNALKGVGRMMEIKTRRRGHKILVIPTGVGLRRSQFLSIKSLIQGVRDDRITAFRDFMYKLQHELFNITAKRDELSIGMQKKQELIDEIIDNTAFGRVKGRRIGKLRNKKQEKVQKPRHIQIKGGNKNNNVNNNNNNYKKKYKKYNKYEKK